jgi:two-component system, NarL family, sensor kinase
MTRFAGGTRLALWRLRRLTNASSEPNRLRFALLGPLVGLALGAAGALAVTEVWGPQIAGAEAVNRAEVTAVAIAEGTVGPLVTTGLLNADGKAYRVLDEAMQSRVREGSLGGVKIWDATGQVIYAAEPGLLGHRLPLAGEHHELLLTGGSSARRATEIVEETPQEESPENVQVAVLAAFRGADGERYLLEAEVRSPQFRDAEMRLIRQLTVVVLLVVGVLFAVPSSLFLASRLKRFRIERSGLVSRATNASLTERRKLAQALHDDVVHELAGLGFALSATVAHLPPRVDHDAQSMLRTADGLVARSVGRLREILADIYPQPDERTDLAEAVEELAEPLRSQGVKVRVLVPTDPDLEPLMRTVLLRLCRELLRNVDRHAEANHVEIEVARSADTVALTVTDNGLGFDPSVLKRPSPGHVGLVMLVDAVEELGGSLRVTSAPRRGCRVEIALPTGGSEASLTSPAGGLTARLQA